MPPPFSTWPRDGALTALEADVGALDAALAESAALRDLIASPVYGRDDQAAAWQGWPPGHGALDPDQPTPCA